MKRIGLFLGVQPHAGGMFQYAQSLLGSLSVIPADKYCVEVAYVGPLWKHILQDYRFSTTNLRAGKSGLVLANAIMVAQVPGPIARTFTSCFNPLAWQLASLRCDLWIFPSQDAIAYQLRLPIIATVHDLMHRYEPVFPEVAKGRRYQIREHRFRNLVTWARGVLVDSEVGRTHVVDAYGTNPEKVYPLPYIPNVAIQQISARSDFESRYILPEKFFFYPAQFWAHKNHMALISAAADIKAHCPDIHFVFAGARRHEYKKVREHATVLNMLDHITFAGYVPDADLPVFYQRARAMIMPTYFGPTNIPPLEALYYGCPVAVSGIYAMPERLGNAALYFDPRSVSSIASVLERLWLDDAVCERLKANAKEKSASWGAPQFNERFGQIIDRLLYP